MESLGKGMRFGLAAAKYGRGMNEKRARKYRSLGKLPHGVRVEHFWRTRKDPFNDVWPGVEEKMKINPGLEAKTLFEDLQRQYPGRFDDGQLRTLQRRGQGLACTAGAPSEVFFPQVHKLGELRYEQRSPMVISHLPFCKWERIFKDSMTTAVAIDRLVHHSIILELILLSYRLERSTVHKKFRKRVES
jgi:hypothetical protein